MSDIVEALTDVVGGAAVSTGDAIDDDYTHDEALTAIAQRPVAVVRPGTTADVARVVELAAQAGVPLTARGSGTGLSGACIPVDGGIVVSFERMNDIIEIDLDNHVAVVQPGVTLDQLDEATATHGLVYPVFPGESSASLGGNVATNAGGMRAVKYGVTRHHVLGLEAVLATGEMIRRGGKLVKTSTGYDLTQLIIGSEGTLALVTQVTVKLVPLLAHRATLLAPFRTLAEATGAVPALLVHGVGPLMVEYIDQVTMMAITAQSGVELGVSDAVRAETQAYLLVVVEGRTQERVDEDMEDAGGGLGEKGE